MDILENVWYLHLKCVIQLLTSWGSLPAITLVRRHSLTHTHHSLFESAHILNTALLIRQVVLDQGRNNFHGWGCSEAVVTMRNWLRSNGPGFLSRNFPYSVTNRCLRLQPIRNKILDRRQERGSWEGRSQNVVGLNLDKNLNQEE
jgi:hypothetical protein